MIKLAGMQLNEKVLVYCHQCCCTYIVYVSRFVRNADKESIFNILRETQTYFTSVHVLAISRKHKTIYRLTYV